jgi:hypothetical protein
LLSQILVAILDKIYQMKILLPLFACLLFSATLHAQDTIGANEGERKALMLINSLPEVKEENSFRKKHKVKLLLKAYMQNTPTKEQNYYEISVSEDLGFQLRTYEWYEVDAKTFVVKYWDIASGKTMSLSEKRRLKLK